jgi:hypothetical protein
MADSRLLSERPVFDYVEDMSYAAYRRFSSPGLASMRTGGGAARPIGTIPG